jgi:hypothetical protein
LTVPHQVAEFGCRPRCELSVPHAVDQAYAVKNLGKLVIVRVIHQVEVSIDYGRDDLDLIHFEVSIAGSPKRATVYRTEPTFSAATTVAYAKPETHYSGVIS